MKRIVKYPPGKLYHVRFVRNYYCYGGKMKYYSFELVRRVKRKRLKEVVRSGKINAFNKYNPKVDKRKK